MSVREGEQRGHRALLVLGRKLGSAIVVLGLVLFIALRLAETVAGPATIPMLRFENPTLYDLQIEVSDVRGEGWTRVGVARKESTTPILEVVDQGETWAFRFASHGEDGGEVRSARAELVRNRWVVHVSRQVGKQLAARGAPPSP